MVPHSSNHTLRRNHHRPALSNSSGKFAGWLQCRRTADSFNREWYGHRLQKGSMNFVGARATTTAPELTAGAAALLAPNKSQRCSSQASYARAVCGHSSFRDCGAFPDISNSLATPTRVFGPETERWKHHRSIEPSTTSCLQDYAPQCGCVKSSPEPGHR